MLATQELLLINTSDNCTEYILGKYQGNMPPFTSVQSCAALWQGVHGLLFS